MSISDRARALAFLAILAAAAPAWAADRAPVVMPVPGQPFFFQLAPIFVPVIDKDRISRQVSIAIAIEIADGSQVPAVEAKRQMLDDAFLRDVYVFVQQRGGVGRPQAEQALKEKLRAAARRILDPVAVTEVDIEEFFERQR
jgi:flagellar basal body-associated protein FliL